MKRGLWAVMALALAIVLSGCAGLLKGSGSSGGGDSRAKGWGGWFARSGAQVQEPPSSTLPPGVALPVRKSPSSSLKPE